MAANPLQAVAAQIEAAGKAGDLAEAASLADQLTEEAQLPREHFRGTDANGCVCKLIAQPALAATSTPASCQEPRPRRFRA